MRLLVRLPAVRPALTVVLHTSKGDLMADKQINQDGETGVWAVTTETATYIVNFDEKTLQRTPAQDAPEGTAVSQLRKDTESVPLLELLRCNVGEPLVALIDVRGDGVVTARQTTHIQQITELTA